MRKVLLSAALVFAASPVIAADYFYSEPPPAFGYSYDSGWTGQYLGATLGGQRTRIETPSNGVLEGTGLIGGFFAGVNFQEDNGLVMGAEADAEWNGFDQSAACANPNWFCNVQGSLRARVGYAADTFHLYGTVGLAAATVGGYGWTAGAGAEMLFDDSWFGRVEYRYTALGSATTWGNANQNGVTSHALKAGIGYRF